MNTTIYPRVYVGTYAKYNNGDISGQWIDLSEFDSDTFFEKCREIHSDESDPEFMFQDCENDPGHYISESSIDPAIWEYIENLQGLYGNEAEAYKIYVSEFGSVTYTDFRDKYLGFYDSEESYAVDYVNNCYDMERMMGSLHYYFDYSAFARDLFINDLDFVSGHVFYKH